MYNTDELELITRNINKANKKTKFNKLYKFTVTTDKAQAYHEKCDDTNSTLLLLETVKGKKFGGLTTCLWAGECDDKKDENALVLNLDNLEKML